MLASIISEYASPMLFAVPFKAARPDFDTQVSIVV
jgi:hypothetical protein